MFDLILVDDEPLILEGMRNLLDWEEFDIRLKGAFANGEEALAYLLSSGADMVITDIQMPRMTGLELLREIRRRKPDIRVVILSGYDDFSYVKQSAVLGIDNYILKPIDVGEFSDTLYEITASLERDRDRRQRTEQSLSAFRDNVYFRFLSGRMDYKLFKEKMEVIGGFKEDGRGCIIWVRCASPRSYESLLRAQERVNDALGDRGWAVLYPDNELYLHIQDEEDCPEGLEVILAGPGGEKAEMLIGETAEHPSLLPQSFQSLRSGFSRDSAGSHPRFAQLLRLMGDGSSPDLSLKTLANQLDMNPHYLGTLFKRESGRSFSDYLTRLRLDNACHLLTGTSLSVREIATATGFSDVAYFHKTFKKFHDLTPAEFRDKSSLQSNY